MISIPVFITMINDCPTSIYKHKCFLPYVKSWIENYGLMRNCVFMYCDDTIEEILKENNLLDHSYKIPGIDKLEYNNGFIAVYNILQTNKYKDTKWFIHLDLTQIGIRSKNTIYELIRNINDNYDFLAFYVYGLDKNNYELDENNKMVNKGDYRIKFKKYVETSIYCNKVSWFNKTCEESDFNPQKFVDLVWSDKTNYKILDITDQVQLPLMTIDQVDAFVKFIEDTKKGKVIY